MAVAHLCKGTMVAAAPYLMSQHRPGVGDTNRAGP